MEVEIAVVRVVDDLQSMKKDLNELGMESAPAILTSSSLFF